MVERVRAAPSNNEKLNSMNHLQVWEQETATSTKEQLWLIWVKKAEVAIGHSLDGDEFLNGYSLDGAYDCFNRGLKVSEYITLIKDEKARIASKKDS